MDIAVDLQPLAVPIDSLELLPDNPRKGDVELVARSLARFGQRLPITARRSDRVVSAGNHTLRAARMLEATEIAVVWTDDDDATMNAWALASNRIPELSDYDDVLLAKALEDLEPGDLEVAGWDDDSVAELIARITSDDGDEIEDPDNVPPPPPPISKTGDVWLLGDHRVLCGDSTDQAAVIAFLDGARPDIVWTDPPYGISYTGGTKDALTIGGDGADEYGGVLTGALDTLLEVVRPGAAVYVAAPAGPAGITFAVELDARGLFRQRLVWVKDQLVLGRSDYHYIHEDVYLGFAGEVEWEDGSALVHADAIPGHEDVYVGYAPGGKGRRGRFGGRGWFGDDAQTSVLQFDRPKQSTDHPTMKPTALIEYCLTNSSAPGHLVLDLFGGSGSTLIAAQMCGRRAALVEKDPVYVDVICRRWQEATGTVPVLERTGRRRHFTR